MGQQDMADGEPVSYLDRGAAISAPCQGTQNKGRPPQRPDIGGAEGCVAHRLPGCSSVEQQGEAVVQGTSIELGDVGGRIQREGTVDGAHAATMQSCGQYDGEGGRVREQLLGPGRGRDSSGVPKGLWLLRHPVTRSRGLGSEGVVGRVDVAEELSKEVYRSRALCESVSACVGAV